jgi:hypothetical protein
MSAYFSFERMITTSFVKVVYFLGFLILTAGGIGLMVWAGLQLNDATIDRNLGWRYVAVGAAALVIGNIVWRVACELWVVLFGIHEELVNLRYALQPVHFERVVQEPALVRESQRRELEQREIARRERRELEPRDLVTRDDEIVAHRPAGVLGLS